MDFFGTPWSDLTLAHVEAFLADQEDEGLTWETKGTDLHPQSGALTPQVEGSSPVTLARLTIDAPHAKRAHGSWP
jgi:hypothetical protein